MSNPINTKHVKPAKETKQYEIEVYVAHYTDGLDDPFVTAGVTGGKTTFIPSGDIVERYVFKVERPELQGREL